MRLIVSPNWMSVGADVALVPSWRPLAAFLSGPGRQPFSAEGKTCVSAGLENIADLPGKKR